MSPLVLELNIFLWRPQIWRHLPPFTVHVKLPSIILGAHYHYHLQLSLFPSHSILLNSCPNHTFGLSKITQNHSPVTVVNSLRNSFYYTLSFLHTLSLSCHTYCHCHYHFPLQISQFRPNLNPVPYGALQSSVLRNGETKMHKTLTCWCWGESGFM